MRIVFSLVRSAALVLVLGLVTIAGPGCASGPGQSIEATDFQVVPSGPGRFIVTAIRRLGGRAAAGDAAVRASTPARAREHGRLASARAWLLVGRDALRDQAADVAIQAATLGLRDLGEDVAGPPPPPAAAADTTAEPANKALLDRLERQIKAYRKAHFADFAE